MGEKAWCKGFKGKLAVAIIIIILKIILIMHDIIYIRTLRKSLGSCINWIYWGFRETCGLCCMCSMYYLVRTRLFLHSHICNVYITYIYSIVVCHLEYTWYLGTLSSLTPPLMGPLGSFPGWLCHIFWSPKNRQLRGWMA